MEIVQDMDQAIGVMYDAGKWLEESGKHPSESWQTKNLNKEYLSRYAKLEEFFVAVVDEEPAAAAILQFEQIAQDWAAVDKGSPPQALYIHWLAVARAFAGKGLPKVLMDFARSYAIKNGVRLLRLDTNANELKLRKIYEDLGFVIPVHGGVFEYCKRIDIACAIITSRIMHNESHFVVSDDDEHVIKRSA